MSAVDMLVELDDDLRRRHIVLCVARDIGQVRDVVETTGGAGLLERVYPTTDDAVRALTQPPATNDGQPEEN